MSIRFVKYLLLICTLSLSAGACSSSDVKTPAAATITRDGYEYLDLTGFADVSRTVEIVFVPVRNGNKDCPRFVSEPFVRLLDKSNNTLVTEIIWKAVRKDGTSYKDGFSLYFNPFTAIHDKKTGTITSAPVKKDLVSLIRKRGYDVDFKYTVVGDECKKDPLDPRIRID